MKSLGWAKFRKLNLEGDPFYLPVFAEPQRMAFRSATEKLYYLEGNRWRTWTMKQITGASLSRDDWDETPYFDKSGKLSVNMDGNTWKWTSAMGWKKFEWQRHPVPEWRREEPPAYTGFKESWNVCKDRRGVFWIYRDGKLYKAAYGLCLPQKLPQSNPLRDGRSLDAVWIDNRGRPLFQTDEAWQHEFFFGDIPPLPETVVELSRQDGDSVQFTFRSGPSRRWYRWRLDGKSWSDSQEKPSLFLGDVPSGKHTLEVAAINEQVEVDPTPAKVTFTISVTSGTQVARFINQLRDPDYAKREAAIKALAKQPRESTLSSLETAKYSADLQTRWWIEAAIEEIRGGPKLP